MRGQVRWQELIFSDKQYLRMNCRTRSQLRRGQLRQQQGEGSPALPHIHTHHNGTNSSGRYAGSRAPVLQSL